MRKYDVLIYPTKKVKFNTDGWEVKGMEAQVELQTKSISVILIPRKNGAVEVVVHSLDENGGYDEEISKNFFD